MKYCDLCHEPTRNRKRTEPRKELLCNECRAFVEMYANYTAEDWDREYQMIAEYEADHGGDLL